MKDLIESAINFEKRWNNQVEKAYSEAFYGKKNNRDDFSDLSFKYGQLKFYGRIILDNLDAGKKETDPVIKGHIDRVKTTITQLKRISGQLVSQ